MTKEKNKRLLVILPQSIFEDLTTMAKEDDRPVSAYVRKLIIDKRDEWKEQQYY